MSQWLEGCRIPNAWFSLEDEDNDLRTFATYFVAAVRTIFPDACPEVTDCLNRMELPAARVLGDCLRNDIDALHEPMILALDDYHRVHDSSVNELLDRFLGNGPPGFHLVILSRRDPSLSIAGMRARGQLTEVRLRDLRLASCETRSVIERTTGREIDRDLAEQIQETTDGWAAIVRLAALTLRGHSDPARFAAGFSGGSQEVQDYLLAEVLAPLAPEIRECLRRTSILNRLCAPLCEALCRGAVLARDGDSPGETSSFRGGNLPRVLREIGLPFSTLDKEGAWVRLHHLIRDLLERQLREHHSEEEIAVLHRSAAEWFEGHGYFEEAIRHALRSDDPAAAGRIVIRHRFDLTAKEQWVRLIQWLSMLPKDMVHSDPALVITYARTCDKRGRYSEVPWSIERAEDLLESSQGDGENERLLRAEIAQMKSVLAYHLGDAPEALAHARQALEDLPEAAVSERVYATMINALSLQMNGDRSEAYQVTHAALQRDERASPTCYARLLQTLCFLAWIDGDLATLKRAGRAMLSFGREQELSETTLYGSCFLGAALYEQNSLEAAEEMLMPVTEDPRAPSFFLHVMAVHLVAMARYAREDSDGAASLAKQLHERILDGGGTSLLAHALALQAELALLKGAVAKARAIVDMIEVSSSPPGGYHFAIPELTVAKVLISEGSRPSLRRAGQILEELSGFYQATHNRKHQIEVAALQALLSLKLGDESAALGRMEKAVAWAQPGGLVRIFVDVGPEIARLLNQVEVDEDGLRFVGQVLTAFSKPDAGAEGGGDPGGERADANQRLIEPLTRRERDVLFLLAKRLSNKEIAQALGVSDGTVKTHSLNIYGKLGVHDRVGVVAKARGLGLLE